MGEGSSGKVRYTGIDEIGLLEFGERFLDHFFGKLDESRSVYVFRHGGLEVLLWSSDLDVLDGALAVQIGHVNTHAIDASFQPKRDRLFIDGFSNSRVFPIEVRLRSQEGMQVVLIGSLIVFPS